MNLTEILNEVLSDRYASLNLPSTITDEEVSEVYSALWKLKIDPNAIRKMPHKDVDKLAHNLVYKYSNIFDSMKNAELILLHIIRDIYGQSIINRPTKLPSVDRI